MTRPPLEEIEAQIITLSAEEFGVSRDQISLDTRPVQDLGIDSLDLTEWIMKVEEHFQLSLPDPDRSDDLVYKEVFTRADFSLRYMAELVHISWYNPHSSPAKKKPGVHAQKFRSSFSQLGGVLESKPDELYRSIGISEQVIEQYRRMTDGMTCLQLPRDIVEIGSHDADAGQDERSVHTIDVKSFLIDTEVVSTTAYCRFLNSIGAVGKETLKAWFLIEKGERRFEHQVIYRDEKVWCPKKGADEWPMVLVSWYGANAYALWANGEDWKKWSDGEGTYLPTEVQWEYAARGAGLQRWPWGDREPEVGEINAGIHARSELYDKVSDLPLIAVNELSGVSPFGVLQMAGNVWQWCQDWYSPEAYMLAARGEVWAKETGVRSERGGSWVGPVELARSSYRRGRRPDAKGRCLGFRCIGQVPS